MLVHLRRLRMIAIFVALTSVASNCLLPLCAPGVRSSLLAAELVDDDRSYVRHLKEIERKRHEIIAESLDETVRGLLVRENYHHIHDPGGFAQNQFKQILSNRRAGKLIAFLAKFAPDEAEQKYQELFDDLLVNECQATFKRVLESHRDRSKPRNEQSMDANALALGSVLFGMAHLGKPALVAKNLRRMEGLVHDNVAEIEANKESYPKFFGRAMAHFGALDAACQISLMAYAVEHSAPDRARRDAFRTLAAGTKTNQRPMTSWDAELTTFESTVNPDQIVENVTFYSWSSNYTANRAKQTVIVHELIKLCLMCN